ncbi:MAG: succinylglutamate desuccinylase/aspartoacylase family protein [Longimicrobiales bacterium]|nr:succinylglutamate desuccinylase/aspartoacylase family protein [Longimicrobiales bacterium]
MSRDRVLGHVRGEPGPTVVLVGGLHGNEPAGVEALERVFDRLPELGGIRGEVLAVAGNLEALRRGVRFVDTDMNREWWPEAVAHIPRDGAGPVEDEQRRALLEAIEPVLDRAEGPPIVVDFHTTSGDTPPFITLGDTLRNREFARQVPVPMVLGLEEQLAATFLEYVNNRGCITLGCEGGRHDDPAAVDHLEAVAWIVLAGAGVLRPAQVPDHGLHKRLREAARGQPRVVEIRYRHAVPRGRTFLMDPGFASFQRVSAGQRLGSWGDGRPVVAPEGGRLLMPLYQEQGDDGFFLTRDVRRFWLGFSTLLRRLRADRIAPLLPGVRRHPYMAGAVIVDRRVARWYTVEIFHLLGFRREVEQGHSLILSRRHFDQPGDWR